MLLSIETNHYNWLRIWEKQRNNFIIFKTITFQIISNIQTAIIISV